MATAPSEPTGSQGSAEERKRIETLHERLDLLETHLQQLRQDLRQTKVRVNRQAVLGNMIQQVSRQGLTSQAEVPVVPVSPASEASETAAASPTADVFPSASEPAEPADRFAELDALEAQAGRTWLTWLSYACFVVGAGLVVKHICDLGWISPAMWLAGGWAAGSMLLLAGEWVERNDAARADVRGPGDMTLPPNDRRQDDATQLRHGQPARSEQLIAPADRGTQQSDDHGPATPQDHATQPSNVGSPGSDSMAANDAAMAPGSAAQPVGRAQSLVLRVFALVILLATVLYLGVSVKANYLMPGSPGLGLHLTLQACFGILLALTAAGGAGLLARAYVRSNQPADQVLGEIFLALAGAAAVLGGAGLLSRQPSVVLWFWSILAVGLCLGMLSYRTKVLHVPLVMTAALLAGGGLLIAVQQGQLGDTNLLWQVQRFGPITCSTLLPAGIALVVLGFWNARLVVHPRTTSEPMPLLSEVLAVAAALGLLVVTSLEAHRLFQDIALVHEVDPARTVWPSDPVHAEWVTLSALWALLALVYVVAGLVFSVRGLRLFGLALFAITAIKVLLLDMARVELVYRAACTIGLGVLSLLGSYVYRRARPGQAHVGTGKRRDAAST